MTNSEMFEEVFGFDPFYLSFQEWLRWLDQPFEKEDEE